MPCCPYCDGYEVRDKRIGVLATGPFSPHQAQLLRQWSEKITYFTQQMFEPDEDQRHAMTARSIQIDDRPVQRVIAKNDEVRGVERATW